MRDTDLERAPTAPNVCPPTAAAARFIGPLEAFVSPRVLCCPVRSGALELAVGGLESLDDVCRSAAAAVLSRRDETRRFYARIQTLELLLCG